MSLGAEGGSSGGDCAVSAGAAACWPPLKIAGSAASDMAESPVGGNRGQGGKPWEPRQGARSLLKTKPLSGLEAQAWSSLEVESKT